MSSAAASVSDLRAQGNGQFRRGEFLEAVSSYTAAIKSEARPTGSDMAVILGNRSACYLSLALFADAERDARDALALDPTNEKFSYRLFNSLKGMMKFEEAASVLSQVLQVNPRSEVFLKLQASLVLETTPGSTSASSREGAILIETLPTSGYNDTERSFAKNVRTIIKQIQRGELFSNLSQNHHLSGVFKSLCEKQTITGVLFPGVSAEGLREGLLPCTLRDVLLWKELILDVTKIAKAAASVFQNIKKRAAGTGDFLDQESEQVLSAQIVQEALARELVDSVRRLSKQMSKVGALTSLRRAVPTSCVNLWLENNQLLDEGVPETFLNNMVACQESFLGRDWADLVGKDMVRFAESGGFSTPWCTLSRGAGVAQGESASPLPVMAYIDLNSSAKLEEYYPALTEAVLQLQKLPYELNARLTPERLKLLEPAKGCTLLFWYPPGSSQNMRLDNVENDLLFSDSGVRLTCSYHIARGGWPGGDSGKLAELSYEPNSNIKNPASSTHAAKHDMLTIHQSTQIKNKRSAAGGGGYFALLLLVHAG